MAVKANYMQSSAVFSVFAMTTQICELDGKILSGARSVYSHNKLHLNDEHECSICKKSFATLEYLSKHQKNVHSEATYNCNECEESFKLKYNLKRHIENIHLKVECCCEICGTGGKDSSTLSEIYLTKLTLIEVSLRKEILSEEDFK